MFDLDNFDLDVDDDFSTNIFSKGVNLQSNRTEKLKTAAESASKCENDSHIKHPYKSPTNLENLSSNISSTSPDLNVSKENSLKRGCFQYEKIQNKRISHERLIQRKFPGPAGLLPDKPLKEIADVTLLLEKKNGETDLEEMEKPMVYSQCSGSLFLEPSYQKLLTDFNLNESTNSLNRYTVEWLKKTALSKGFQGRKIPFLGLVVHSVNHTMLDPVVVLRDPTGEVHGSLHREVWADLGGKIKAGIALALRQVGVLITGVIRRQIYLNITMNNILAVYGPSENESQVEITTVNKISKLQLLKSLEECLPQSSSNISAKSPSKSSLFTTVHDDTFPCANKGKITSKRELPRQSKRENTKSEEIFANLGIILDDKDFEEELNAVPRQQALQGDCGTWARRENNTRGLSQEESLIFEEVLSGIDLEEFES